MLNEPRYTITATKTQVEIIDRALELFMRVHIGQLHYVAEELSQNPELYDDINRCHDLENRLRELNCLTFPPISSRNGSPGIFNARVADCARVARDMSRLIQNELRGVDDTFTTDKTQPGITIRKEAEDATK